MLNVNTVSAANPKSRLQPRTEASLSSVVSYGSINSPLTGTRSQSSATGSIFFPLAEAKTSENTQRTHFIEIPKDILNHIAGFLGYNETLKKLLPTSAQLFVTVMDSGFKIKMNMPMPNRTILTHEACYVDLKKMQMEEFERQMKARFGDGVFKIFDRLGSDYWQGGVKFGILAFLIYTISYIFFMIRHINDPSLMSFFITLFFGSSAFPIAFTITGICSKPNASKLKENIECVAKSVCFNHENDERSTVTAERVRSRFREEQRNHQAFLRLYENVRKRLER